MKEKTDFPKMQARIESLESTLRSYRKLINNSPDLIYRTDLAGIITFISPSVLTLSGYTEAEAVGMKMAEEVYLYPHERQAFLSMLREKGSVKNFEARLKRKDGSVWWASTNAHFYSDEHGQIVGVEGIARDVTELKMTEQSLRESEELFRTAFRTSPDSINLNRLSDGLYLDSNEGFSRLTGYSREEVIGRTSLSLNIWADPEDRQKLVRKLQEKGYVLNMEARFIRKNGSVAIGLMSAKILAIRDEAVILSITRDVTEYKRMEQRLYQSQKFEALGTLAGGVAHDFNNLLMGIQGRASMLAIMLEPQSPLQEHIRGIAQCVDSAANLTGQLLGYARGGKYEVVATDIEALLKKSAELFGRTRREVTLLIIPSQTALIVEADQQQLSQVFLNIFINSWQAMPTGGQITVTMSTVTIDAEDAAARNIAAGPYCNISIRDTGTGMDEETMLKAFDPFFTTKDKGRGTGLGLASALGIVQNHGGQLTLSSEIDIGTTVSVFLPLSDKLPVEDGARPEQVLHGSEKVILVDDEAVVVEVGKDMLESLGYQVQAFHSGQEMLASIRNNNTEIRLIILDLVMPGMDGVEVFRQLQTVAPAIPVLISSGYSIEGQASELLQQGGAGFLQKPFTLEELSCKVREILDNPSLA